jgi:tetratricopeptide (TPR) repeat protein
MKQIIIIIIFIIIIAQVITETTFSAKGDIPSVQEHLLSYAEFQFGDQVKGKHYREREDGECISNWQVEITCLHSINQRLAQTYMTNVSLSNLVRDNLAFPYREKSLKILSAMLAALKPDDDKYVRHHNYLMWELFKAEQVMAVITMSRNQFNIAEGHCQRCLDYAKRFGVEGNDKTEGLFQALKAYCALQSQQGKYLAAVALAEEAYNIVVTYYNPGHPRVQEAAGILIANLSHQGDIYNAERYADITLSNLEDPLNKINQESEEVAFGAYNLSDVLWKQGTDLVKAEKLSRQSLRIREKLEGDLGRNVGMNCNLLANILRKQGNHGDEVKDLLNRSLAIDIRNDGPDGVNTAVGHYNLAGFHVDLATHVPCTVIVRRNELTIAKASYEEALRIQSKVFGPSHPTTKRYIDKIADVVRTIKNSR